MKTKRLFISTLIAAAAMGLSAYANEAATQTTPIIAETDAPEGADRILPLADAPTAEDAEAPADEETQDEADALELLLADDALVELDEAAAPDELSTETMMREWIARYAAAARFAGIRAVKGTGGGLSSGGALATAGAELAVSAATPTPSVSVPAAGTVSLADTLTRASAAADVSLGSASASDAGTPAAVATTSSSSGASAILPAAFFSTRGVFAAVPAATASYSLASSSGVAVMTASETTNDLEFTSTLTTKSISANLTTYDNVSVATGVTGTISFGNNNNKNLNVANSVSIEAEAKLVIQQNVCDLIQLSGLTGSGDLTLSKASTNAWGGATMLVGDGSNFTGTINVWNGTSATAGSNYSQGLHLNYATAAKGATIALGNYTSLVVSVDSAEIAGLTGTSANSKVVSYACSWNLNANTSVNPYNTQNPPAFQNNDATVRTLKISGNGTTYSFAGTVGSTTNQSSLNLTKSGTGTQTLSGTTYLGNLEVSGGELALSGTVNIAGTTTVSGGELVFSGTANIAGTTTVSGGTLDISAGTTTLGGALTLSGGNVAIGTLGDETRAAVAAAGAVTISNSVSVMLSGSAKNGTFAVFSGSTLSNTGTLTLSATNGGFAQNWTTDGNVTYVTISGAANNALVWAGGTDSWTWDMSDAKWKLFGAAEGTPTNTFTTGDDVKFATAGAQIAFDDTAISAGAITIAADTTFSGTTQKLSAAGGITVWDGASLTAQSQVWSSGKITGGIKLDGADAKLILVGNTALLSNAVSGTGTLVFNQTNTSSSLTINGTNLLQGGISVEKTGSGTLSLGNSYSYNGNTTVSAGALNVSDALTTTGKLTVARDASMTLSAAGRFTQLSGEGVINLGATGTLTLSNATKFDNWTGTIKVGANTGVNGTQSANWNCDGAMVEFSGAQGWLEGYSGGTFSANIKLVDTASGDAGFQWKDGSSTDQTNPIVTLSGKLTGTGTFERANSGFNQSFVFSGDLSEFTGTFKHTNSLNYARLTFGGKTAAIEGVSADVGSVTGTSTINWYQGTLTESQDKCVYFNYSNDVRSDSTIRSAILVKQGAGSLTLTGTNTYAGGTTVEAGTLIAANSSALGTGTVTAAGSDSVNEVTLKIGASADSALTIANNIFVLSGKTLILESSNDGNTLSGELSGAGKLTVTGTGKLTLSGADTTHGNTISGGVVIDGATLSVNSTAWGNEGNLGSAFEQDKTVLKNGGVLEVTAAQNTLTTEAYRNGGAFRAFSVTEDEGTYRYTGTADSEIAYNSDSQATNQHIGLADGATLIFDVTQDVATLTVTKVIANTMSTGTETTTGALKKIGEGTLVLNPNEGTNNFTGGVTIEKGTLVAGSANALGTGTVTAAGSDGVTEVTLKIGANADAALTIANDISVSADKTLILESSNDGNALSGELSGALKLSSGTLSISGSVAGESSVTASAGTTLKLTSTTAGSFKGDLMIENGAKVSISGNETLKYSDFDGGETMSICVGGELDLLDQRQTFASNVKLTLEGGTVKGTNTEFGSLDFTGANTISAISGNSVIEAGVRLRDTNYDGSGDLTFDVAQAATLEVSGVINPSTKYETQAERNIIKTGEGELTLSGANTNFKGDVTIEAGTLIAAQANALGKGKVTVGADGKLGIAAGVTITEVSGGIELANGAKIVVDLSNLQNKTENFEVKLATETAIELAAEVARVYSEGDVRDLTAYLDELKGWTGWTPSLTYANKELTLTMVIPEPSLFGLLAGATALGFSMSSRRRRRKA